MRTILQVPGSGEHVIGCYNTGNNLNEKQPLAVYGQSELQTKVH
ncbi:MAG: hypothetical protein ABSD96_19230 [Candidatus Korobacteraceae bacterium]